MKQMEIAQKYKSQSIHYLENVYSSLDTGYAEKAGEFLWGSMAEAIKAVAASEGRELKAHWEISDYARELAKKRDDKSIWDAYGHASYFHHGFYEAGLTVNDVRLRLDGVREIIRKLLELLPEKESD
ncbi:MAG: PaREP1 family protein [Dehalococcoidales bacterium]|nr:PaREP1 family protein [Dehalococcoidales bacterium]